MSEKSWHHYNWKVQSRQLWLLIAFTLIPNSGLKRALETESLSRPKYFNNNVTKKLLLCYSTAAGCCIDATGALAKYSPSIKNPSFIFSTFDSLILCMYCLLWHLKNHCHAALIFLLAISFS